MMSSPHTPANSPKQTYCTNCKANVDIANAKYVRLANRRAVIEGQCSRCGMQLIKARIMPRSSALIVKKKKKASLSRK